MTIASSTIKKTAKESLKGNWVKAIIACAVVLFCYLINNSIGSIFYIIGGDTVANVLFWILNFFMLIPVILGAIRYFWRLLCGVADEPLSVFYYFASKGNYLKSIKLAFLLGIKLLLYAALLLIPYFAVSVISNVETYEFLDITIPLWTANLSNLSAFLQSIALIGTIFLTLKYYLAPMLIVADDNMDVNEAIHMSVVISKNTILDLISLSFSMLGWILLSILFIPLIYTIPLFITVYLTHCTYAVGEYNEYVKKVNMESFPSFVAGI